MPLPDAVILFCSSFPFPLSECHRLLHCCANLRRGEHRGKGKIWQVLPELPAPPMPQLQDRNQRLEGMGGKFTFGEARAMPRSGTHLLRSANSGGTCSRSHLLRPSALRLVMSCWLRKYKPQAAFWSLSAALLCQAGAFLSSDTKCSLRVSPRELTRFLPQQPQLLSAPGSGTPGGLAERPLCTAP